ncbi:MAG: tetratricopeptide repeat protein, partial [Anaerolineales bacterium]|nr:tetratricopeptide repeat protein [Anaerolineales bacterium]
EALNRGHAFSWDQRWDDAVREFEAASAECPADPGPYAGLGMAFVELGQLDRALEGYKLAARYSQGDIIYLRQVAEVQERLHLAADAGQTYMAIGEILLRQRLLEEAMENWHRAVRLDPHLLGGHQRLATVYQRQGNVRAAIREYLAIARVLQDQGDAGRALQTCQAALKLDPRNADVLTAIELIQHGEEIFVAAEEQSAATDGGMSDAGSKSAMSDDEIVSPVQEARRMALEQLAEELFDEEEEIAPFGDDLHVLSKLERDALLSQALDYQTRGMSNEAISAYEQAIEAGLRSAAVHFNLGLLYQDKLRFEDAIHQFEVSVRDNEYRIASLFSLGECHRARGRIDMALEHFITVLKIVDLGTVQHDQADRLIELYENLSDSLLTKGEPEQATAFANALVEFLSQKGWEDKVKEARARLDALSYGDRTMILGDILTAGSEQVLESLYLSQEYARRGMYTTAIEESYRAIQLSPYYLPAHWQLGEMLARQDRREAASVKFMTIGDAFRVRGDVNGAINAYERVVEINPLDVPIRARLIEMLKRHGQIDRSLEHYMAMGNSYYQLAQVDKARETYQEALKLAPRGSARHNWRARLLRAVAEIDMERLDWRRALLSYRELRAAAPEDERTAMALIDLYYKVGQPENGLRELDRYLIQLVKNQRGGKLLGILQDMVNQRPRDPGLVDRLARLYLQQKRTQDAINVLDKLGEAQLEAGETEKAVATIQKIIKLKPANVSMYIQLLRQLIQPKP